MNTFITMITGGLSEMKSGQIASMVFLSILIAPMFVPVVAQSNHTLEWGAEPTERFTYVLQRAYYSDSSSESFMEGQLPFLAEIQVGEKFILEIESLETIEDQINESSQIPLSFCNLRREDDDTTFADDLSGFVLPVGDWDFLEEIENNAGLTFSETQDEWGNIGTGVIPGSGGNDITVYVLSGFQIK